MLKLESLFGASPLAADLPATGLTPSDPFLEDVWIALKSTLGSVRFPFERCSCCEVNFYHWLRLISSVLMEAMMIGFDSPFLGTQPDCQVMRLSPACQESQVTGGHCSVLLPILDFSCCVFFQENQTVFSFLKALLSFTLLLQIKGWSIRRLSVNQ